MELSVYDIHHIIAKYLNLRQHVYIVSDCLVFFCSFLCCQCGEYFAQDMPMDGLSETSSVMYQITPRKLEVNTVRSEELSKPHQSEEKAAEFSGHIIRCTELWSLVDQSRELDGKVESVQDDNIFEPTLKELPDSPYPEKKLSPVANRSNDYPTVHSHKRAQEQHLLSTAETSKNLNSFGLRTASASVSFRHLHKSSTVPCRQPTIPKSSPS